MENVTDLLRKVERVEASPFLYTRVMAKIKQQNEVVPKTWLTSAAIGFCTILILNVFLIGQYSSTLKSDEQTSIQTSLNLKPSNQLYYD